MAVRRTIEVRGVFTHTLDEKSRVIVPQTLRPKTPREVIVLQHPKAYLAVMTQEQFDELHDRLMEEFPDPEQQRDFGFVLNHMARSVPIDSQGRMGLSAAEIAHAGIDREIVFTVTTSRSQFEIWNPSRHAASVQEKRDHVGAMMQRLGI